MKPCEYLLSLVDVNLQSPDWARRKLTVIKTRRAVRFASTFSRRGFKYRASMK